MLDVFSQTEIPEEKLKEICEIYDEEAFLTSLQTQLISFISTYYFSLIHQSTTLFFPKNLRGKVEKKKFQFVEKQNWEYDFSTKVSLNFSQQKIFEEILSSEKKKFLLYGVTGSGKTEIYIQLMREIIQKEEQVLLLVPEIILTNQIFDRITKVFGKNVLVLNSSVSDAKKTLYWQHIHASNAKIIV